MKNVGRGEKDGDKKSHKNLESSNTIARDLLSLNKKKRQPRSTTKQKRVKLSISRLKYQFFLFTCKRILNQLIKIDLESKTQTKKIRKLFLSTFKNFSISDLLMKKCLQFPCIYFQCKNDMTKKKENILLRDLIKYKKLALQKSSELISVLFERLYDRVDPKYFGIAIFGIQKARQHHVPLKKNSVFNQKNLSQELMFYYAIGRDQHLNFVLIDKYFNVVDFTAEYIHKQAKYHPKEFNLYNKQLKEVLKRLSPPMEVEHHYLQIEEIESDAQIINFQEENIQCLQKSYENLLNKDISSLEEDIQAKKKEILFQVFMLHGKIAPQEQKKVFQHSKQHKIIFASRIAETAITIDGVRVVIDPGEDIEMVYDQQYKFSSMKNRKISQSSAKQRAGRAGRTAPGYCFRLYSEKSFIERPPGKTPEMENSSLDTVVLRLKSLKIEDVVNFRYISEPNRQGLQASVQTMKMIGGLNENQKITVVGELLIKIPIEPMLSRSIIEAILTKRIIQDKQWQKFRIKHLVNMQNYGDRSASILTDIISILCMVVNSSGLFIVSEKDQNLYQSNIFDSFSVSNGDFFFLKEIYQKFKILNQHNNEKQKKKILNKWIKMHFLSKRILLQVQQLEKQITKIIKIDELFKRQKFGNQIDEIKYKLKNCSTYNDILLSCLIASFCPNLCLFSSRQQIGYTLVSQRISVQVYKMSTLALMNEFSKWIICYDLCANETGRFFCKIAQQIDFTFLKNMVSSYFWKRFELSKAEELNPYYEFVQKDLPTVIYHYVKMDYLRSIHEQKIPEDKQSHTYIFNDQTSKVTIAVFHKQAIASKSQWNQYYCQQYQMQINHFANLPFFYSYHANTKVTFSNGFVVESVEEVNKNDLLVLSIPEKNFQMLYQHLKKVGIQENSLKASKQLKKIQIIVENDDFKTRTLQSIKQFAQCANIELITKVISKKSAKICQEKLLLIFFSLKPSQSDVNFLYFGDPVMKTMQNKERRYDAYPSTEEVIDEQKTSACLVHRALQQAVSNFNSLLPESKRISENMSVGSKKSGIHWTGLKIDEYELSEFLDGLVKYQFFEHLTKPKFIKNFREMQFERRLPKNKEWRQEVNKFLISNDCKFEDFNVTISKKRGKQTIEGIHNNNYTIFADVTFYEDNFYEKVKKYDKQEAILGEGKLHIKRYFTQTLAFPSEKLFQILAEKYSEAVNKLKNNQVSRLVVEEKVIKLKKKTKILIIGESEDKEILFEASNIIGKLFEPKIIELDERQHKLLQLINKNAILDHLEYEYLDKIYFMLDRNSRNIKMYCPDELEGEVVAKLKQFLKINNYNNYFFSYSGKNLSMVIDILENIKKQVAEIGKVQVEYTILFNKNQICVYTGPQEYQKIKSAIHNLSDSAISECQLCQGQLQMPYKLLNCFHSFCRICLKGYIKTSITHKENHLKCPMENCHQGINMYDVQLVMGEEMFEKQCEQRFVEQITQNSQIQLCPKCLLVIWGTANTHKIQCDFCGYTFCKKCRTSHKRESCESWQMKIYKQMRDKGIMLEVDCKKCKNRYESVANCNHNDDCKTKHQCLSGCIEKAVQGYSHQIAKFT